MIPKVIASVPAICGSASGALENVVLRSVVIGDPMRSMLVAVVTLICRSPL